ncbi:MAG: hypothetical protein IPN73_16365 [Saprospiraceae bacterium]|nr:hypothetical protein [Saprospiraceae bacterium]MBK8851703.1 hypothetical protein [Saprospiraceae bacterium]
MRGKKQFWIWLMTLLVISCGRNKQEVQAVEASSLPADFEVFYEKFHKDTAYQVAHILFPLEGQQAKKDDGSALDPNFKWQKKGWLMHKPYDDMGGTFSRSFLSFNDIVTEDIADGTGQFTMTRRFTKMDGEWYLIYYKEMGRK